MPFSFSGGERTGIPSSPHSNTPLPARHEWRPATTLARRDERLAAQGVYSPRGRVDWPRAGVRDAANGTDPDNRHQGAAGKNFSPSRLEIKAARCRHQLSRTDAEDPEGLGKRGADKAIVPEKQEQCGQIRQRMHAFCPARVLRFVRNVQKCGAEMPQRRG